MTWQAFLDLSSAEGTAQIPACWVSLDRWYLERTLQAGPSSRRFKGDGETCGYRRLRILIMGGIWGWGKKGRSEQPAFLQIGKDKVSPPLTLGGGAGGICLSQFSPSTLTRFFSLAEIWLSHLWNGFHISSVPRIWGDLISFDLKCII